MLRLSFFPLLGFCSVKCDFVRIILGIFPANSRVEFHSIVALLLGQQGGNRNTIFFLQSTYGKL